MTFNFMKNKQTSLTLINQASFTEKRRFSANVGLKSINLLFFALTQQLVFPEALN